MVPYYSAVLLGHCVVLLYTQDALVKCNFIHYHPKLLTEFLKLLTVNLQKYQFPTCNVQYLRGFYNKCLPKLLGMCLPTVNLF